MMRRVTLIVVAILVTFFPGAAYAQVDAYHFTGINFDFANPGARARGIGGAFVALADDSSAALANPAGLAFLDRQFSLELIHDEEKAPVGQRTQGDIDVEPVGGGSYNFTALNDPFRVSTDSTSNRINNASFVFPVPSANLGLAVYYASLADLNQDYEVGPGLMCVRDDGSPYLAQEGEGCTGPFEEDFGEVYTPFRVTADLESNLIGVALGWKLGDSFAIGGSAAYAKTTFSGRSAAGLGDQIPWLTQTSTVDDDDVMYSLGLLYRGSVVGFGLNYRSEMSFKIENDVVDVEGNPIIIPTPQDFTGDFRIPERLAAGLAFFPGDHWVIAAEYVRIPYSTIPKGMPLQFDKTRGVFEVEYSSSDVNEIHLGAEYTTFSGGKGWSVRAGYWRDESHLIYSSQGYNDPIEEPMRDRVVAAAALFYEKLELNFDHFTAGFGASLGKFRVDLAVDYSPDAGTDFLVSGVFYF